MRIKRKYMTKEITCPACKGYIIDEKDPLTGYTIFSIEEEIL